MQEQVGPTPPLRALAGLTRRVMIVLLVFGVFVGVFEAITHAMWGTPPPSDLVQRINQCVIRTYEEKAHMDCQPDDIEDVHTTLKPPGKPRVIVLGGSTVKPLSVTGVSESFPEALARMMPEIEVLNFGVAGLQAAGVYRLILEIAPLEPDLIMVYTGHNDYNADVFRGAIQGTRMWLMPLYLQLEKSWLHALTARKPVRNMVSTTERHNRSVFVLEDDLAQRIREDVDARYAYDLEALVRASPAPVVLFTMLRNPLVPPSGTYVEPGSSCEQHVRNLEVVAPRGDVKLRLSEEHCGEGALTSWHRSHVLAEQGDSAGALAAWYQSLDQDAMPLRAPTSVDGMIREVAASTGARLIDLEADLGPLPPSSFFLDTLHLSPAGAEVVAREIQPVVQELLSP